jgi:hypothetical protein
MDSDKQKLQAFFLRFAFLAAIVAAVPVGVVAQPSEEVSNERLAAMNADEVRLYVRHATDEKLAGNVDGLILLAMNRSEIVVPELVAYLAPSVAEAAPEDRPWQVAADILAYVADERAIEALARLCTVDEGRFTRFVGRAFDYSQRRTNPYKLAYYSLNRATEEMKRAVTKWIDHSLTEQDGSAASGLIVDQHLVQLAEAVLARYAGNPTESTLTADPIASRLIGKSANKLRDQLLKSATKEVEQKSQ